MSSPKATRQRAGGTRRMLGRGAGVAAVAGAAVLALTVTAFASPPGAALSNDSADARAAVSSATTASVPAAAAAWTFDEGTGTTAKDSAGSDDATLGSAASWSAGHIGAHAVAFDGSSNGAAVASAPAVDTSQSFTVSTWVKFSAVTGYQTITGIDGANIGGFFLQLSGATGKFAMTRRASDSDSATEVRADSSVAPVAGAWYHVVGVDNAQTSTLQIYVDGQEGADASFSTPWKATGATSIGRGDYNGPTDFVHGAVDDVQYFASALTAEQVANLDQAAHWTYDEGTGTTAADSTGNGNTQTLGSGAGWAAGRVGAHALSTNGTANGAASASSPVVDTRYSFSVAAWVKLNGTTGYQDVASVDGANVSGFYLQLRGDTGKFAFTRLAGDSTSAAAAVASASSAPQTGVWYHLVGVDDAETGTLSLYVNGTLQSTVAYATPWQAKGAFVTGRGYYASAADFLNGDVDDVQALNYAATGNEISAMLGDAGGELTVDDGTAAHALPSSFFGLMTEDINHSMTGGLYAELINNRSMLASSTAPVDWNSVNGASLALDKSNGLNSALTQSLKVTVGAASSSAPSGVANSGYWGIPVKPSTTYRAQFFAMASSGFHGPLTLAVQSSDGSVTYAKAQIDGVTKSWKQFTATLKTTSTAPATSDARYVITTTGNAGKTLWLDNVSLFPPTYDNVSNGLRTDLMTELAGLKPSFIREPGGNYLEGNTLDTRFNWKNTIGPTWTRPGHEDDAWGYYSTDGMGLLEYLEWCEQLGAQPMLAVFAGYTLNGTTVPQAQLQPYVQDALDEIQYATGPVTSTWGAQRAKDGHPAPFKISYVEVGNEDFFDKTGSYDSYRFPMFYDAIKKAYPSIKLVATASVASRTPDVIDDHYYQSPAWMNTHANQYDTTSRTGPKVLVGEWASQEGAPTPDLAAAIGDASWLTGLIRDSDVVMGESYAPLLVNVNDDRWKTNLIGFDSLTSYVSPSYWVQQMLANNHGDQVLNASYSGIGGLNVTATRDSATGKIYVVIVNPGGSAQTAQLNISGVKSIPSTGKAIVLTSGSPTDTNTISSPNAVAPTTSVISGVTTSYSRVVPPNSVTVLDLG
ncbi:LamG-like jellyroll fold domain-containing protein [Rathayibacter sp. KR2-224]|uniref:LamG-like jellyroll fold domain-containing protein n=1 Tax=Rathayibacter sp. KR2-224 TaxID=3400913 RepID=UPI003C0C2416